MKAPDRPPDYVWAMHDDTPEGEKSKYWFNEMITQSYDPLSKTHKIEEIETGSDGRIGRGYTRPHVIERYQTQRMINHMCSYFDPIQTAYKEWRNDVAAKELLDYDNKIKT